MKICPSSRGKVYLPLQIEDLSHTKKISISTLKEVKVSCLSDGCTRAVFLKLYQALSSRRERQLHITYRYVTLVHVGINLAKEELDCWTRRTEEEMNTSKTKSGYYSTGLSQNFSESSIFQTPARTSPAPGKESEIICK